MKIKRINYYSVPKHEAGTCNCCGKGILNICAVTTVEGEHFIFGTTCFDKLIKDRLQSYHRKQLNKALKSIKIWSARLQEWEGMTEDKYIENLSQYETDNRLPWETYEDINSFEDYKEWYINTLIPARLDDAEKEVGRFSKIEF